MFDRSEAARQRIRSHVGRSAQMYAALADRLMALPDHPLRDRALLRLANSLDDVVALEERVRQSRSRRSPRR